MTMARKRPPTTSEEIIQRRDELFEALSKESDRGVVLISASFLDEALEALLRAKFSIKYPKSKSTINKLFDGPLNTFSAKIKICYAIDLIGEWVYRDLEIIRKLRNNYFAHSVGIARFDLPEVVQLTEKFKAADLAVTQISKEEASIKEIKKKKATKKDVSKVTKADMERARFEMSVSFIGALLYILTRMLNSDVPLQDKESFIERVLLAK
jgi:DNA-binding MltR family transcriptional regulator